MSGDLGRHSPTPGGFVLLSQPRPSGLGFPGPRHPLQLPSFSSGPSQRTLAHRALLPEGRGWGGASDQWFPTLVSGLPTSFADLLAGEDLPHLLPSPPAPWAGYICLQYICPDAWKTRNLLVQSPALWATGSGVERLGGEGGRASGLTGQGQAFRTLARVSVTSRTGEDCPPPGLCLFWRVPRAPGSGPSSAESSPGLSHTLPPQSSLLVARGIHSCLRPLVPGHGRS